MKSRTDMRKDLPEQEERENGGLIFIRTAGQDEFAFHLLDSDEQLQ
jgi:hypothetical protein